MAGDVGWSAPLHSWIGAVTGGAVTVGAAAALLTGAATVFTGFLLLGGLALLVPSVVMRLEVTDDGVAVRPFRTRVHWDDLDWIEARGAFLASLRIHRVSTDRPTQVTVQPIGARPAAAIVDRINDEVQRRKATS